MTTCTTVGHEEELSAGWAQTGDENDDQWYPYCMRCLSDLRDNHAIRIRDAERDWNEPEVQHLEFCEHPLASCVCPRNYLLEEADRIRALYFHAKSDRDELYKLLMGRPVPPHTALLDCPTDVLLDNMEIATEKNEPAWDYTWTLVNRLNDHIKTELNL